MPQSLAYQLAGHITAEAPISVNYFGMDHRLPRTPHGQTFLNGGTLRGPLRKAALRAVIRLVAKAQGVPLDAVFDRGDLYMLGEGVDITRGVNNESSGKFSDPMAENWLREFNPFISLFGRWKLAGHLEVSPMLTSATNLIDAGQGMRHDQFEHDPGMMQYLNEEQQDALLTSLRSARESMDDIEEVRTEVKRLKKAAHDTEDREERRAINDQIHEMQAQEKAIKKAREGAEQSIKHPIAGYEAIAPGSELSSTLRIIQGTPTHLGLILHALAEFSQRPRLGGHAATGSGDIRAEWEVFQRSPGEHRSQAIGRVVLDAMGFDMQGEALESAFADFEQAVREFDFRLFTLIEARQRRKA